MQDTTIDVGSSRLGRNVGFQGLAQAYAAAANLLLPVVIVSLGVENAGIYQVGMVLYVLFRVVSDLGVGTLCIRDVARTPQELPRYQAAQLALRAISATCAAGLMLVVGYLVYGPAREVVVAYFAIATFLLIMAEGFRWTFRATQRMGNDAIVTLIERTATLTFTIVAVTRIGTVEACAAAFAIGQAVNLLGAWSVYRGRLKPQATPRGSLALLPYLLRTGPGFVVIQGLWALYSRIDYLILDKWPTASDLEVGLYALAYLPLKGLLMVPEVSMMALFPALAELFESNSVRFQDTFARAFRWVVLGTLGVSMTVFLLHRQVTGLILLLHRHDEDTSGLSPLICMLVLAAPLYAMTMLAGHVLAATGGQWRLARRYGCALVLNVVANVTIAIPWFGAEGCAVMTVATEALVSLLLIHAMPTELARRWRGPAWVLALAMVTTAASFLEFPWLTQ